MDERVSIRRFDPGHAGRARLAGVRVRVGDDEAMNGYEFESDDDVPPNVSVALGAADVLLVGLMFAVVSEVVRRVFALVLGG